MSLRVSGNNYSNYQSMYQTLRTLQASRTAAAARTNQSQAVAPINRVPRVKPGSVQYADTLKFVQNYGKGMADVKMNASKLQSGNSSGVFSGVDIQSSDASGPKSVWRSSRWPRRSKTRARQPTRPKRRRMVLPWTLR